ncbi:unnamed protein product [Medioppia subpectinata]|uniref:Uncharacterized protein n=1 Tax=Medioppia subpectinata TaxID=1979941 RepID=A0A7R9Q7V9_9ACAR|nr:unnamed protein product [Medioppia subpectinata]CAG2115996.1 unnamed protein product [Medioppia subpectinata]
MKLYFLITISIALLLNGGNNVADCGEIIAVPGSNCHLGQAIKHMFELSGMTLADMDRVKIEVCKRCESCCKAIDLIEKTVIEDV